MTGITTTRAGGIGALSRAAGVKIETIRYYEKIGLLAPPPRTRGGNRQYDFAALQRLVFIRRCRALGFSIEEIRALLAMVDQRGVSCGQVHAMTLAHLDMVEQKMAALRQMRDSLRGMADQCSQGDVPDCPIVEALFEVG